MTEEQERAAERAAFEAWASEWLPEHQRPTYSVADLEFAEKDAAWEAWQARAALSQPASPYLKKKHRLAEEIAAYHRARLVGL